MTPVVVHLMHNCASHFCCTDLGCRLKTHVKVFFFASSNEIFFCTIKLSGASLSANGLLRSCSWVLKHLSVQCQVLPWGLCSGSSRITWIYYQWSIDWCKSVKQLDYVSESHGATIIDDIFVAWCVQGYASKWKGAYSYITVNDATQWIFFGWLNQRLHFQPQ